MVLIDMAFNMGGTRLGKFLKLKKGIEENNFEKASAEILNSLYAK